MVSGFITNSKTPRPPQITFQPGKAIKDHGTGRYQTKEERLFYDQFVGNEKDIYQDNYERPFSPTVNVNPLNHKFGYKNISDPQRHTTSSIFRAKQPLNQYYNSEYEDVFLEEDDRILDFNSSNYRGRNFEFETEGLAQPNYPAERGKKSGNPLKKENNTNFQTQSQSYDTPSQKPSNSSSYDFNDVELLEMILNENSYIHDGKKFKSYQRKLNGEDVPPELEDKNQRVSYKIYTKEGSPAKLKQFIDYSATPEGRRSLMVSQTLQRSPPNVEGRKTDISIFKKSTQNQIRSTGDGLPEWAVKKGKIPIHGKFMFSDESDDDDNERGNFCGLVVNRRKKKIVA